MHREIKPHGKYLLLHKDGSRCDMFSGPMDELSFARAAAVSHGRDCLLVRLEDMTPTTKDYDAVDKEKEAIRKVRELMQKGSVPVEDRER